MSSLAIMITKIAGFIITLNYVFILGWVIGLNTITSAVLERLYLFGHELSCLVYLRTHFTTLFSSAPMLATILGELTGHFAFEFITRIYMRHHNGHLAPEARLILVRIATPLMVLGIVLLGFSLPEVWHNMTAAVNWSFYVHGIIIFTAAIDPYILDAYPEA